MSTCKCTIAKSVTFEALGSTGGGYGVALLNDFNALPVVNKYFGLSHLAARLPVGLAWPSGWLSALQRNAQSSIDPPASPGKYSFI